MGAETGVEWTRYTLSFWLGCLKISPECDHCYAEIDTPVRVRNARLRPQGLKLWGPAKGGGVRHVTAVSTWKHLETWNRAARKAGGLRPTVFCNANSDFFEDFDGALVGDFRCLVDLDDVREAALNLMLQCDALEFLVLTKRPENVKEMVPAGWLLPGSWPQHIRIGTTAGTRKSAAERLPHLQAGPWPNFVSAEPLLEEVDLAPWLARIGWLIVGGESGSKARPCDLAWLRSAVAQAKAAGVPVFVKQLGSAPTDGAVDTVGGPVPCSFRSPQAIDSLSRRLLINPKGGDMAEWPADLRVREFPQVSHGR